MYEKNKWYKFQLKDRTYYTGKILSEDGILVNMLTRMNENVVISKSEIRQSIQIKEQKIQKEPPNQIMDS